MEDTPNSLSDAISTVTKRKWISRIINFGLIPFLVLAALFLPPISLKDRILGMGYTTINQDNWSVEDPDGTRLEIPPAALSGSLKIKLTLVPRQSGRSHPRQPGDEKPPLPDHFAGEDAHSRYPHRAYPQRC